jgi:hypothetical protein
VIPLAVVMAYADEFWIVSLRGAAGSIERVQEPFMSWLRESTLLLPVFVFAVLGALTLALRMFGPGRLRARAVAAASLLVVAAGTVAAVIVLAASTAYDYRLQVAHLGMSGAMRGDCAGGCLAEQQHATLMVDVKAVAFGSAIILATNVLLVGWLVSLRGGRLTLDGSRRRSGGTPPSRTSGCKTRVADVRFLLVTGLVGSAVIHTAVVPAHLREWPAAGTFFMALAATEIVAAVVTFDRPTRHAMVAVVVISVGPLLLWMYSRTLGMPFGPGSGVPERVGLADGAACALEIGTLVAALLLLRSGGWLQRPARSAHGNRLAVVAVVAVIAVGLGGSGIPLFDVAGGASDHAMSATSP